MTSQQILAFVDQLLTTFWAFAKGVLAPIAVLCGFVAGVKMTIVIAPFIGGFVPSFMTRGDVMPLAATAIACALASRGA